MSSVWNMTEFLDLSLNCNAETLSLLCSLFKVPVWFQSRKIEMHASLFLPVFEHAKYLTRTYFWTLAKYWTHAKFQTHADPRKNSDPRQNFIDSGNPRDPCKCLKHVTHVPTHPPNPRDPRNPRDLEDWLLLICSSTYIWLLLILV